MVRKFATVMLTCLLCAGIQSFAAVTLNFEGMPDMISVTDQYACEGVIFEEALILTAFSSLNEFDFPPHSGDQVLGDDWGPIVANFLTPVSDVSAYFTYTETLSMYAYDSTDTLIGTASSLFFDNYGYSELISLSSATPISRLVIEAYSGGASFIMDDFEFEPIEVSAIPVPSSLLLGAIGTSLVGYFRRSKNRT